MRQHRKKQLLFSQDPPIGPFGLDRAERPMGKPNELRRDDFRERTNASQFVEKEVPVLKDRYLRWFTPELYARRGGKYYHKRDKRFYPVIDTQSSNPFRRFKFIKTYYRKKRFYTSDSQKEVKPYTRRVIDLTTACAVPISGSLDLTVPLDFYVPADTLSLYEAWIYTLALADNLDPLTFSHEEEWWTDTGDDVITEHLTNAFIESSRLEYPANDGDYYFYSNRVDAFKAFDEGHLLHFEEANLISRYDHPPWLSLSKKPFEFVNSIQFQLYAHRGEEPFETIEEINIRLLSLGLRPKHTNGVSVLHGITGPSIIKEHLDPLWLYFEDFEYDSEMITKGSLSQIIPFTDLTGYLGYHSFLQQPVRGLPALNQFIGELPETVKSFADILRTAIKIAKALKRKDLGQALQELELGKTYLSKGSLSIVDLSKAAVSVDLFYKFGLMPFIDDLRAISDAGSTFGDFALSGFRRRLRVNWENSVWKDRLHEKTLDPFEFEVNHGEYHISGTCNINLRLKCNTEYGALIRVKDPISFVFESMGLTSILSTAWELLPLSFVIDWFVDVGNVIDTLTTVNLNSFDITSGYQTFATSGVIEENLTNLVCNGDPLPDQRNEYYVAEVSRGFFDPRVRITVNDITDIPDSVGMYEKFVLLGILKPQSTWNLSTSKIGTLAELLVQRVRS